MADTGRRAPLASRNDMTPDAQADETRMRRALGLGTGSAHTTPQQRPEQARARHRFVQDGGVPVVMLNAKVEPETAALRERISTLESQLEAERGAHAVTRRQLDAEHHAVTALQTRIAHNDLAHKDLLEQERRLREAAQAVLQEALANAAPRRHRANPVPEADGKSGAEVPSVENDRLAALDLGPAPAFETRDEVSKPVSAAPVDAAPLAIAPVAKRPRGRPRSTALPEPKPVRWWTPSYRTKKP